MVIDSELPIGIIANTSAILGITLGKHIPEQEHNYFGIAIYGNKKKVNKLTGFMPLLR